jgi:protein-tyrosine phosphatase
VLGRHPDVARIIPGLWVGSAPSTRQAKRLTGGGITAVVDLRAENGEVTDWPPSVQVCAVPLVDHGTPTQKALLDAAQVVGQLMSEGHEVLVHCRAGLERSATVACAVLMMQGWTLAEAYRQVTLSRRGAAPTEGQLITLRAVERARRPSSAKSR